MADYINVTSLNRLAKQVLAQCEPLNDLIVCGEISGFVRHYKSGHMYFTLKDENASVKSVMFRSSAQLLNFQPQNGMLVLAYGHATLYERDGAFQLYVDYMKPFTLGRPLTVSASNWVIRSRRASMSVSRRPNAPRRYTPRSA